MKKSHFVCTLQIQNPETSPIVSKKFFEIFTLTELSRILSVSYDSYNLNTYQVEENSLSREKVLAFLNYLSSLGLTVLFSNEDTLDESPFVCFFTLRKSFNLFGLSYKAFLNKIEDTLGKKVSNHGLFYSFATTYSELSSKKINKIKELLLSLSVYKIKIIES